MLTFGMIFAVKQGGTMGWITGEKGKDFLKYISSQNLSVICDLLLFPLFIIRDYIIN